LLFINSLEVQNLVRDGFVVGIRKESFNGINNNHAVVENFTTQRKKVPPLLLHSIDTLPLMPTSQSALARARPAAYKGLVSEPCFKLFNAF
jgi:hypothetical protein